MNLLSDIITYIRRIIKSPSNAVISDNLIIDYINRFWLMDVDARIQLFDLKTKYQFQTTPGVDQYNMPLYDIQTEPGNQTIASFPVYQGFMGPAYINGVPVSFHTQKSTFFNWYPNVVQNLQAVATGNGTTGPYTINIPILPNSTAPANPPINALLRGHVDISGIIATGSTQDPFFGSTLSNTGGVVNIPSTSILPAVYITSLDANGNNVVVQDSGQFLQVSSNNYGNLGLLMVPGSAPFGYSTPPNGYTSSFPITGASQATQCVLTCTSTFLVGQVVQISGVGGMVELNGNIYTITAVSATTVTIDVDSTGFTAYTAGGTATTLQNVINYTTGVITEVIFPSVIPSGQNINVQCYYFQSGLPRSILYYNNTLTLRAPPATQYLVELDAYLTPTAFLNTSSAIPFGYMAEYIARGAARKILSDTGDVEQFQFYEPLFREQEMLVWKRSQRQWTATRTETIYSTGQNQGNFGLNNGNGATF